MLKTFKIYCFSGVLKMVVNMLFMTCSWSVQGLEKFKSANNNNLPILLCFWHCQLLCVSRYFKNSALNLYGISSTHFDSEILARVLRSWKIKLIKGSSTRGWFHVLKKMMLLFQDRTTIITITNDGPKGPPKIAKKGSLLVAKKYNAQIIAVSAKVNKCWFLKSWDQTIIPKPFSTIYIKFSDIYPPKKEINQETITSFINANEII